MPDLAALLSLLRLALKDRQQLVLENIALRHQLAVYKRSVKRPRIEDRDRFFWLAVMRMLDLVLLERGSSANGRKAAGFLVITRARRASKTFGHIPWTGLTAEMMRRTILWWPEPGTLMVQTTIHAG